MEWTDKLQAIIDYVENHLQRTEEPVNPDEISRLAGCSYSFFQKVFSYMNGISFADYIRFRKLTLAGYDLKSTQSKVVDISYKYGYESPTSFTKAFKQFHGISPAQSRNEDAQLKVFPKMKAAVTRQYSWRLISGTPFRLVGRRTKINCSNGQQYSKVPEFWSKCQKDGTIAELLAMDNGNPKGLYGLFGYFDEASETSDYMIAVESTQQADDGYSEILIPDTTWAVFDCRGAVPQAIQDGWKYLTEEWLLKYPFRHADCPELEWYSEGNNYDENYLSQIWIPIIEEK